MDKLIIPLPLMTLNEYTNQQRRNRYAGNKAKQDCTSKCKLYILQAMLKGFTLDVPANVRFEWYCANKKQDPDNIAFQKKFILDGMVQAKLIQNDGWKQILGFEDVFRIDKENPRVEINDFKTP